MIRPFEALKSAAFLLVWLLIALAALSATVGLAAFVLALCRGSAVDSAQNLITALVCGLIAWLFLGVFHLRKETVQLRVSDPAAFQKRMQKILEDLGFQWVHMSARLWRTRPGFRSLAMGSGVIMQLHGATASLTGPRLTLDRIRRRYRLASQLDRVQKSLQEGRPTRPECYLKRLEVSVRLNPDQLAAFHSRVVEPLAQEGEVLLDLQLLVSDDQGIPESLWSQEIRPWLEDEGLYYQFHKDHPQQITPVAKRNTPVEVDSLIDTCVWT